MAVLRVWLFQERGPPFFVLLKCHKHTNVPTSNPSKVREKALVQCHGALSNTTAAANSFPERPLQGI